MKNLEIYILIISMSLFMGCENYRNTIPNREEKVESLIIKNTDENAKLETNKEIIEMYSNLDTEKENLKYNILDKNDYYYETEKELVGMRLLNEIPKINDKKYAHILNAYAFSSLSTKVSMKYERALDYVKKVLPNDIQMEREKFNPETGSINIFYSSSKGNFIANLNCENYIFQDKKYVYDKSTVSGISYMKEFLE